MRPPHAVAAPGTPTGRHLQTPHPTWARPARGSSAWSSTCRRRSGRGTRSRAPARPGRTTRQPPETTRTVWSARGLGSRWLLRSAKSAGSRQRGPGRPGPAVAVCTSCQLGGQTTSPRGVRSSDTRGRGHSLRRGAYGPRITLSRRRSAPEGPQPGQPDQADAATSLTYTTSRLLLIAALPRPREALLARVGRSGRVSQEHFAGAGFSVLDRSGILRDRCDCSRRSGLGAFDCSGSWLGGLAESGGDGGDVVQAAVGDGHDEFVGLIIGQGEAVSVDAVEGDCPGQGQPLVPVD